MQFLNDGAGASAGCNATLLHQLVVNSHQLCVVVILKHKLARPHFCFLPQEDFGSKMPLQLFHRFANVRIHVNFREVSSRHVSAAKPTVQSGALSIRRGLRAAHSASAAANPAQPAKRAHVLRSIFLLRSIPESLARVSAGESHSPLLRDLCRCARRPPLVCVGTPPSIARTRGPVPSRSDLRAGCFRPASFPTPARRELGERSQTRFVSPARCAARQRRSPAISWKRCRSGVPPVAG